VRRFLRRGVRLELVAALCVALSVPALGAAAESATGLATETNILAETHDLHGHTQAAITVTVLGEDGLPAAGAVSLRDGGRDLAGAALDAKGEAHLRVSLAAGSHLLQAVYGGDSTHLPSLSHAARVEAQTSTVPTFTVALSQTTLTVAPGASGTVTAIVTPVNSSNLSGPMFVTLSCSGLPDQAACAFSPENVEILPNATAAVTSTMTITTQLSTTGVASAARPASRTVALAFLLPGAFLLGGLAWSVRRRASFLRLSILALLALVTLLGATGCNPRYDYFNHGPTPGRAVTPGNYTVIVAAQSSDGVTAITNTTDLALTVSAPSSQ
jgi:hypothetical protein